MMTLCRKRLVRVLVPLCMVGGLAVRGYGQANAPLGLVDTHFAGMWVGTNHDYTKVPMVANPVRIEIRDDPKKHELRMDYTYGIKGQRGYDHRVRFLSIEPATSTVEFHWQHRPTERYLAAGLDEVLRTGYGVFTCAGMVYSKYRIVPYRGMFDIEADRFTYSWEKSDDGVTFAKTGEWVLTRESAETSPTTLP